jgi:hypothetical protein
VYITTTTGLVLQHSTYTDWQTANANEVYSDVAVTAPSVGAYFAGPSFTDARSYCPASTITGTGHGPDRGNDGRKPYSWRACDGRQRRCDAGGH